MTKQEKRRRGLERILDELLSGDGSIKHPFEMGKCIDDILAYFDSKGEVTMLTDSEIVEALSGKLSLEWGKRALNAYPEIRNVAKAQIKKKEK